MSGANRWAAALPLLTEAGVDPAGQSESALTGIRLAYTLVPGSIWLVAMILLRFYTLDEDTFNSLRGKMAAAKG